jgi:hypothetical protein
MFPVFRISTPADAVAVAVVLVRYLPEHEMVVFAPHAPSAGVMVCQMGAELPAEGLPLVLPYGHPVRDVRGPRLVVVFGSDAHAEMGADIVRREFPHDEVMVVQFYQGCARRYFVDGSVPDAMGEEVDLSAHPYVVGEVFDGRVRLASRAQIRAGFAPAQFGAESAGLVAEMMHAARAAFPAVSALSAAETVHREALAGYLEQSGERGIEVSNYHAAMLAAAAADVRVRDVLFIHFTETNAAALGELWRQVGSMLPASDSGPAFVLASLSYWIAREAVPAREAMNVARELDPEHSLGRLLEAAYDAGAHPALWEQIRPAAYEMESEQIRAE